MGAVRSSVSREFARRRAPKAQVVFRGRPMFHLPNLSNGSPRDLERLPPRDTPRQKNRSSSKSAAWAPVFGRLHVSKDFKLEMGTALGRHPPKSPMSSTLAAPKSEPFCGPLSEGATNSNHMSTTGCNLRYLMVAESVSILADLQVTFPGIVRCRACLLCYLACVT